MLIYQWNYNDLSDTQEKNSVSTMRTSTILKTERYIGKIYDETVTVILLELQHRFPVKKKKKLKRTP